MGKELPMVKCTDASDDCGDCIHRKAHAPTGEHCAPYVCANVGGEVQCVPVNMKGSSEYRGVDYPFNDGRIYGFEAHANCPFCKRQLEIEVKLQRKGKVDV